MSRPQTVNCITVPPGIYVSPFSVKSVNLNSPHETPLRPDACTNRTSARIAYSECWPESLAADIAAGAQSINMDLLLGFAVSR